MKRKNSAVHVIQLCLILITVLYTGCISSDSTKPTIETGNDSNTTLIQDDSEETSSQNASSAGQIKDSESAPVSDSGITYASDHTPSSSSGLATETTSEPVPEPTSEPTPEPTQEPTPKPTPTLDPDTWDYYSEDGGNMKYTEDESISGTKPYEIRVNKLMNCITIYKKNKKGEYKKPVKAFVCSVGNATPVGTFHTGEKYYWKAMIHGVWAQYATRITDSFLFHSVPYEKHYKDTLKTNYYNRLGNTASAGCVRLSVIDAKWLIEHCPTGTNVVIYNDSNPGPLGKPTPARIPYDCKWDPTDPDKRNPWNSKKSTLSGVKDRTVERCSYVDCLSGVVAYDKYTHKIATDKVKVKTDLNSKKTGKYKVQYTFKDSKGKKIKKQCVYTVVDTRGPVISGLSSGIYITDKSRHTKEYILQRIYVTDNGMELSKKKHVSVSVSEGKAYVKAHDDYGNYSEAECTFVVDTTKPMITLKKTKDTYPMSVRINNDWAVKAIKNVSDDKAKLSKKDVKISVKPQGWGMKITYSVKDYAGNSMSVSKKIRFEKADVSFDKTELTVSNINNDRQFKKLVKVVSHDTGKKIPYKLKIKRKKTGSDKTNKYYKVSLTITYTSSAGSKSVTKKLKVSVPK